MLAPNDQLTLLLDLEARHDDLLLRLDDLDKRVSKTLAECLTLRPDGLMQRVHKHLIARDCC